MVSKRFPANTTLDGLTFLNDKKINSELYALLQSYSIASKEETYTDKTTKGEEIIKCLTVVYKKDLPKQADICSELGIKSAKTYKSHLNYLIEKGYVIDDITNKRYVLPEMEDIYFLIPLRTIQYLRNSCKEHIYKIYIYLGQRYKWALSQGKIYEFTSEEIGEHIGYKVKNYAKGYQIINDALNLLYSCELIDYKTEFDGQRQKKKLTKFSFDYKKKEEVVESK